MGLDGVHVYVVLRRDARDRMGLGFGWRLGNEAVPGHMR